MCKACARRRARQRSARRGHRAESPDTGLGQEIARAATAASILEGYLHDEAVELRLIYQEIVSMQSEIMRFMSTWWSSETPEPPAEFPGLQGTVAVIGVRVTSMEQCLLALEGEWAERSAASGGAPLEDALASLVAEVAGQDQVLLANGLHIAGVNHGAQLCGNAGIWKFLPPPPPPGCVIEISPSTEAIIRNWPEQYGVKLLPPLPTRRVRPASLNRAQLSREMLSFQRVDRWYIVADTNALLDDIEFISSLLYWDTECRLRIPYEVLHDLSYMMRHDNTPCKRIPARRVTRYLMHNMGRNKAFIGPSAMECEDLLDRPVGYDSFIDCCLQQARHFFYVVLISDNPDRRLRAQSLGLPAYSLQQARELTTSPFGPRCPVYHRISLYRPNDDDENDLDDESD